MGRERLLRGAGIVAILVLPPFEPEARADPVSWTLSASATHPFAQTAPPTPGTNVVYLWFVCDNGQGGMSDASFGIGGSGSVQGFQAAPGFTNSGLLGDLHLTVSGCPTGPVMAGSFTVSDPGGAGFNLCIETDLLGRNIMNTCSAGSQPNETLGFASDGSTPCGGLGNLCATSDLSVTLVTSDPTPREQQSFSITLTLTNEGPLAATSVTALDSLAA